MKHLLPTLAAAALVLGALGPAQAEPSGMPACVRLAGEARMGAYGYDHVVRVENACAQDAECLVGTSVDPTPAALKVGAHASAELIVRLGSPARVFTPIGTCRLVAR